MKIFKSKTLISLAFISLTFNNCGDEPEAPTPMTSENVNNEKIIKSDEDNLTGNGFNKDVSSQDLTLNKLSVTDDADKYLNSKDLETINSQLKPIYFDYDSYEISDVMLQDINHNINIIKKYKLTKSQNLIIEGNCDELGTDEYNYGLGLKRAKIIKDSLVIDGFSDGSIKTVSYGEGNPSCDEHNDDCWAKNRRVDFKLEE